jgi:hypothetical protein
MSKADPRAAKGRAQARRVPKDRAHTASRSRRAESQRLRPPAPTPSRLLPLTLVAAAGLLVTSWGLAMSRSNPGSAWAELLFWLGLVLIVAPFAGHLARLGPGRQERLASLLVVGVLLYLVKVVHDPYGFVYADEWVHVYNAQEIVRTGSLYHSNPILPVTVHYPGLETVTAALASTGGLSVFASGLVVLGVARIVLVLALFLLFERLTSSPRLAGIAGLAYVTNPNFLFWSAQFSYESLALPLVALAVFAVVAVRTTGREAARAGPGGRRALHLRLKSGWSERTGWLIVGCLTAITTAATHHLSSYALCVFLLAVCLFDSLRGSTRQAPWLVTGVAVVAAAVWSSVVAPGTSSYLFPVLGRAIHASFNVITGHSSGRALFQSAGATLQQVAEPWQRAFAIASVGLILIALPFGARAIARRYMANPFLVALGIAAVAYVVILPLRLVPAAWETSNRSSEFLFAGVALTLALAASSWFAFRSFAFAASACAVVLLIGGVEVGWPPRVLLSLPYRTQVAGTVIPTQPAAVASWAKTVLGPGHRFIAPEAVGRELLVNGDQTAYVSSAPFDARTVLYDDRLTAGIVTTLGDRAIGYLAIDRRLSGDDSMSGYFFPGLGNADFGDSLSTQKYEGFPGVNRLLDTGDIVVYDVRGLSSVPG